MPIGSNFMIAKSFDFGDLSDTSKLTERQIAALALEYNLADGHAYRKWNKAEHAVLDATPAKFRQVNRRQQRAIEAAYFQTFFALAEQTLDVSHFERFLCFTASAGIEIIANYLRLNHLSVTLIEPCFDNLKDILQRHHVPLSSFPDYLVEADPGDLDRFLEQTTTDVLFLVSPNNPTGSTIGKDNFARIIEFCARRGVTLILDTCFRFYLPDSDVYDQYQILADANIDCIVIEDTGKTWPTLEIKAPFISVSHRLVEPISKINADFLLHVSPFAVQLMTEFLELSVRDGRRHIRDLVAENRAVLYRELESTFLLPIEKPFMSVAWLKIESDISAPALTKLLSLEDVYVLPGNQFFWTDGTLGNPFVRLALVRDPEMFSNAVEKLASACRRRSVSIVV